MSDSAKKSYDQLPYLSRARRNNHPDTLATVGRLMGLNPEPVDNCRVLEIGCSTGGNLTALAAALPNSQFVGIDLSTVQIEMAKKIVSDLGLRNVEYRAMSLTDFTPADGLFDYIICHGVYSWVPKFVQDKIFEICSKNLAPQGIAYVSYNTLPGWYLRMPARESMLYFLRRVKDEAHRAEAARSFYNFVARSNPHPTSVYGQLLTQEANVLKDQPDYYLAHEHLDAENQPCYFTDFMERATPHGLQYVGNAEPEFRLSDLPEDAQAPVQQISGDLIQLEQFIDMIMGRTFRRTLLCHANVPLNRAPETETVFSFLVSAGVKPKATEPSIKSPTLESYIDQNGGEITSNEPITKAIFWILWRAWPKAITMPELVAALKVELGEWAKTEKATHDTIASLVLQGYLAKTIGLNTYMPPFTKELSAKPNAHLLARYNSQTLDLVPSLRHQEVLLSHLERYVLGHLDGTRTRDEVVEVVKQGIEQKHFTAPEGSIPEAVDAALKRLAETALLIS
jgi:methyltransferase-like protein/2-polyprenyl-3-methyl-5-hydroxy-6-metoxy-1,4-benzoquinol methylase